MGEFILWVLQSFVLAPYHLFLAITNPGDWLNWSNPESLARFIYYGGSSEFFFVVIFVFVLITVLGMAWKREILWFCVRALEGFANIVGRVAAWAGLIMVLQQVMIVFLQRIFRVAEIQLGPLGTAFVQDLSWWGEGLKLYNAMIVCLCVSYTFVQGRPRTRGPCLFGSQIPHQAGDRHGRLAAVHDAGDGADLHVWLVLHVAPPCVAWSFGLGRSGPDDHASPRAALECRDHRFQPQRL